MGNDGILPIICETTQNVNVADIIHCHSTEVISEETWKSLIFSFEHNVGLQKKGCPKTHGLQARFSNVQH